MKYGDEETEVNPVTTLGGLELDVLTFLGVGFLLIWKIADVFVEKIKK